MLEVGRYKGVKRELRFCPLCKKNKIEDEIHFLYKCRSLKKVRKPFLKRMKREYRELKAMNVFDLTKCLLSEVHIKEFACWLEDMWRTRRDILYR